MIRRDKNKNHIDDRFDFLVNACALILPFTAIPQIYTIYIEKRTEGVSVVSWFLYAVFTIPLFIYSLKRKDIPMIILNGLWIAVNIVVAVGPLVV